MIFQSASTTTFFFANLAFPLLMVQASPELVQRGYIPFGKVFTEANFARYNNTQRSCEPTVASDPASDIMVAVNILYWTNISSRHDPFCAGAVCAEITTEEGYNITMPINDNCLECDLETIGLSESAFQVFERLGIGADIYDFTWRFINCSVAETAASTPSNNASVTLESNFTTTTVFPIPTGLTPIDTTDLSMKSPQSVTTTTKGAQNSMHNSHDRLNSTVPTISSTVTAHHHSAESTKENSDHSTVSVSPHVIGNDTWINSTTESSHGGLTASGTGENSTVSNATEELFSTSTSTTDAVTPHAKTVTEQQLISQSGWLATSTTTSSETSTTESSTTTSKTSITATSSTNLAETKAETTTTRHNALSKSSVSLPKRRTTTTPPKGVAVNEAISHLGIEFGSSEESDESDPCPCRFKPRKPKPPRHGLSPLPVTTTTVSTTTKAVPDTTTITTTTTLASTTTPTTSTAAISENTGEFKPQSSAELLEQSSKEKVAINDDNTLFTLPVTATTTPSSAIDPFLEIFGNLEDGLAILADSSSSSVSTTTETSTTTSSTSSRTTSSSSTTSSHHQVHGGRHKVKLTTIIRRRKTRSTTPKTTTTTITPTPPLTRYRRVVKPKRRTPGYFRTYSSTTTTTMKSPTTASSKPSPKLIARRKVRTTTTTPTPIEPQVFNTRYYPYPVPKRGGVKPLEKKQTLPPPLSPKKNIINNSNNNNNNLLEPRKLWLYMNGRWRQVGGAGGGYYTSFNNIDV